MHELKEKLRDVCDLKEKMIEWAFEHKDCVSVGEMGEVVDMIKDLAEVEEKCWKAKYYESVVAAMEGGYDEEEEEGRMGYDHYRYPSSGRFASKGHGKRYGYVPPMVDTLPDDPFFSGIRTFDPIKDYRLGYGDPESIGKMGGDRDGRAYRDFKASKRHYTETHAPEHKSQMTEHAKEHMMDMAESVRDIWESADPDLKKKMKTDLTNLLTELN